jgi:hypothetical protein
VQLVEVRPWTRSDFVINELGNNAIHHHHPSSTLSRLTNFAFQEVSLE